MLVQGRNRVLAPGYTLFEWLMSTSEQAERVFTHEDENQNKAITAISRYFYREVRGNTSQLIRRLVQRVLKPGSLPDKDHPEVKKKLQVLLHAFEDQIIVKFDKEL